MPWVGFEPTTPASERAKTVHALDRAATVTGHCSQTPSVYVPPLMSETKFHTHTEPQEKLYVVLYILIFMFLDSKRKDKKFWTEW
jgi:hypothetical protein